MKIVVVNDMLNRARRQAASLRNSIASYYEPVLKAVFRPDTNTLALPFDDGNNNDWHTFLDVAHGTLGHAQSRAYAKADNHTFAHHMLQAYFSGDHSRINAMHAIQNARILGGKAGIRDYYKANPKPRKQPTVVIPHVPRPTRAAKPKSAPLSMEFEMLHPRGEVEQINPETGKTIKPGQFAPKFNNEEPPQEHTEEAEQDNGGSKRNGSPEQYQRFEEILRSLNSDQDNFLSMPTRDRYEKLAGWVKELQAAADPDDRGFISGCSERVQLASDEAEYRHEIESKGFPKPLAAAMAKIWSAYRKADDDAIVEHEKAKAEAAAAAEAENRRKSAEVVARIGNGKEIKLLHVLKWSEPREVQTDKGPMIQRTGKPNENFWTLWKTHRDAIKAAGIWVFKDDYGQWNVYWRHPISKAEAEKRNAAKEASRAEDADIDIPSPPGLNYLPFQRAGIKYALERKNTLIGDDMGLGKTMQAIGFCNALPEAKKILIVCPASLKLNWQEKFKMWDTKGLSVGIASGSRVPDTDVVIINYDIAKRNEAALKAHKWDVAIYDEAHKMKNAKAQRTQALLGTGASGNNSVKGVQAKRMLMLTGTPIVNRPAELWTLVHALDPHGLGSNFMAFHKRYADAVQTRHGWDFSGSSNLDELQDRLRQSIMVRRLKKDVLKELPEKLRSVTPVELTGSAGKKAVAALNAKMAGNDDAKDALKAKADLALATDDIDAYRAAMQEISNLYSVEFQECSKERHDIGMAKAPEVADYVKDVLEYDGKIILFAHHADVIDKYMSEFGDQAVKLTGDMDMESRKLSETRFQNDPSVRVFVGSITACGEGLTLTAANDVVFGELDWRPGMMAQAEDRAHRIGQKGQVRIHYLVAQDSIESYIADTVAYKMGVIADAVDKEHGRDKLAGDQAVETVAMGDFGEPVSVGEAKTERGQSPAVHGPKELHLTAEQTQAVLECLRTVAALDPDRAFKQNEVGFNAYDGVIGHDLARLSTLTPKQAFLAVNLARKYRRQTGIPESIAELIGPKPKMKKAITRTDHHVVIVVDGFAAARRAFRDGLGVLLLKARRSDKNTLQLDLDLPPVEKKPSADKPRVQYASELQKRPSEMTQAQFIAHHEGNVGKPLRGGGVAGPVDVPSLIEKHRMSVESAHETHHADNEPPVSSRVLADYPHIVGPYAQSVKGRLLGERFRYVDALPEKKRIYNQVRDILGETSHTPNLAYMPVGHAMEHISRAHGDLPKLREHAEQVKQGAPMHPEYERLYQEHMQHPSSDRYSPHAYLHAVANQKQHLLEEQHKFLRKHFKGEVPNSLPKQQMSSEQDAAPEPRRVASSTPVDHTAAVDEISKQMQTQFLGAKKRHEAEHQLQQARAMHPEWTRQFGKDHADALLKRANELHDSSLRFMQQRDAGAARTQSTIDQFGAQEPSASERRYRATMRPPSLATLPHGVSIEQFEKPLKQGDNHGYVTLNRSLTPEEMKHFDMDHDPGGESKPGDQRISRGYVLRHEDNGMVREYANNLWGGPVPFEEHMRQYPKDTPQNRAALGEKELGDLPGPSVPLPHTVSEDEFAAKFPHRYARSIHEFNVEEALNRGERVHPSSSPKIVTADDVHRELTNEPQHVDDLARRLGIPHNQLGVHLTHLELDGKARRLPGLHYTLSKDR